MNGDLPEYMQPYQVAWERVLNVLEIAVPLALGLGALVVATRWALFMLRKG